MKMTKFDTPIREKGEGRKKIEAGGLKDPNSLGSRIAALGLKDPPNPATISSRMRRHDLTFEEAIRYVAPTQSSISAKSKHKSQWAQTTPGSPAEHRDREREGRGE